MRAIRVHESGGIDTMRLDEIPRPVPGAGEVLVAVKAAGVGPWDRLVREGQSGLGQALPLTLGSDVSGTVAALGADVDVFALGEAIYGATNDQFVGGDVVEVAPQYDPTSNTAMVGAQMLFELFSLMVLGPRFRQSQG